MKTADFSYELPESYIAQTPTEPRDSSKLLVFHRSTNSIEHRIFNEICDYLDSGDILVINQTRVLKARLEGKKISSGGKIELLLLSRLDELHWETLVGGKGLSQGKKFQINSGMIGTIEKEYDGAKRLVRFDHPIDSIIDEIGKVPRPPYIHKDVDDPERYQTIYALENGSAAAPTAGLHFTEKLLHQIKQKGIIVAPIILHIGMDTFLPVKEDNPKEHRIHKEWCYLPNESANHLNRAIKEGKRIIAVGTTSVRAIESATLFRSGKFEIGTYQGQTELFILPGYSFRIVDSLITNFHLPRSTLIMMVSSFLGRENLLITYELAKMSNYRFYSFGDAMLII